MAIYAQAADLENYVEGWTTVDVNALERLILRAEEDLDQLFLWTGAAAYLLTVAGSPTGGTFKLTINGTQLTISYNATAAAVITQLQSAVGNAYVTLSGAGNLNGPLPTNAVSVNFSPNLWPVVQIDNTGLTGPNTGRMFVTFQPRKLDVTLLTLDQRRALQRATCAQAEYRNEMGEKFFVRQQYSEVSGPDFNTKGKLPMIGPQARRELVQAGLFKNSTLARSTVRHARASWPGYLNTRRWH